MNRRIFLIIASVITAAILAIYFRQFYFLKANSDHQTYHYIEGEMIKILPLQKNSFGYYSKPKRENNAINRVVTRGSQTIDLNVNRRLSNPIQKVFVDIDVHTLEDNPVLTLEVEQQLKIINIYLDKFYTGFQFRLNYIQSYEIPEEKKKTPFARFSFFYDDIPTLCDDLQRDRVAVVLDDSFKFRNISDYAVFLPSQCDYNNKNSLEMIVGSSNILDNPMLIIHEFFHRSFEGEHRICEYMEHQLPKRKYSVNIMNDCYGDFAYVLEMYQQFILSGLTDPLWKLPDPFPLDYFQPTKLLDTTMNNSCPCINSYHKTKINSYCKDSIIINFCSKSNLAKYIQKDTIAPFTETEQNIYEGTYSEEYDYFIDRESIIKKHNFVRQRMEVLEDIRRFNILRECVNLVDSFNNTALPAEMIQYDDRIFFDMEAQKIFLKSMRIKGLLDFGKKMAKSQSVVVVNPDVEPQQWDTLTGRIYEIRNPFNNKPSYLKDAIVSVPGTAIAAKTNIFGQFQLMHEDEIDQITIEKTGYIPKDISVNSYVEVKLENENPPVFVKLLDKDGNPATGARVGVRNNINEITSYYSYADGSVEIKFSEGMTSFKFSYNGFVKTVNKDDIEHGATYMIDEQFIH